DRPLGGVCSARERWSRVHRKSSNEVHIGGSASASGARPTLRASEQGTEGPSCAAGLVLQTALRPFRVRVTVCPDLVEEYRGRPARDSAEVGAGGARSL